ncbi:MAG: STAS domain-containing protein [Fibrobacter sp.]|jgi:anti-anti-sigma factor|nr:STAS domain-containing protein [Fibrobacter sp.]
MNDEKLSLEVDVLEGIPQGRLLKFVGDLDYTTTTKMSDAITKLQEEGALYFIADFSRLRYINSTGLGALLFVNTTLKQRGGSLKIISMSESVFEIVEIIGAHVILDIYSNLEDAVAALQKDLRSSHAK